MIFGFISFDYVIRLLLIFLLGRGVCLFFIKKISRLLAIKLMLINMSKSVFNSVHWEIYPLSVVNSYYCCC